MDIVLFLKRNKMASFTNKFESKKQDWTTPKSLFDKLDQEFHFEWDLAADKNNALCERSYTKEDDSLKQNWDGVCFLNPPFNTKDSKVKDWIKKAYLDTQINENLIVVMILPARTYNKYYHEYCMKAAEIKFICGRIKFGDNKHGLPQPILICIFKKSNETKFSSFYL